MAKRILTIASMAVLLMLAMGTLAAQGAVEYMEENPGSTTVLGGPEIAATSPVSIDEGILLMREEEKLARDVYLAMYEKWGIKTFANIARSEQQHMDAVAFLLKSRGIEDPVANAAVGEFTNPKIATLYDELIALGSTSAIDALTVGALIEDLDISDLQELLAETDDADTVRVYSALLRGSENHMRSFAGLLNRFGKPYEAQYISNERLTEILTGR
ncbi:MAG: DUF2202 domain-containing protein [Sphaerochaeta sp.]|nr:DUF2202 domain-containing protein [Sphaerochaeta sp.]